jgi:hypothetical protein
MAKGYTLYPDVQMKIEDERAGRLDYVYETSLSVNECLNRIGETVEGKISEYETATVDGVLYFIFNDPYQDRSGLSATQPSKYAVRLESMADKTVIRARYIWDINSANIPYIMKEDIDTFFITLFDAHVSDIDNKVWTDSSEEFAKQDPLGIHGNKKFWLIYGLFIVIWVVLMLFMNIKPG